MIIKNENNIYFGNQTFNLWLLDSFQIINRNNKKAKY